MKGTRLDENEMLTTKQDLAPGDIPEMEQWQDALQKGLGRALLWAKNGLWREKAILLNACLTDLRFDRQVEEGRGPWMWQIMEATGVIEDFREPILESLGRINDLAAQQLCQFCVYYAQRGDHRFRHSLQRIVSEKPVSDCPWLGEEELVEMDGAAGLLFAAKVRAKSLQHREWEWDDKAMMDMAIEKIGEPRVVEFVAQESESSPELRWFFDTWHRAVEKRAAEPKQNHADRMRQYTLSDAIQAAEVTPNRDFSLRGWGMYASEGDLQKTLDCLFNSHNPEVIVNYLQVFSNRPLPQFDDRVLDLLRHENKRVRNRAFTAVAKNTHPAIRKFALDRLHTHSVEPNFLELFIKNYHLGDEDLLLTHLRLPEDQDQRHWLLMDVIKILEENDAARSDVLASWVYRWTPCGSCRRHAAKLLIMRGAAPKWLIEECQYDSDPDTRRLVKDGTS
jgi:hypothetical protein